MTAVRSMLLEKILVPLDGSELSDRIVAHVRRLLTRRDAEVLFVRVIPSDALGAEKSTGETVEAARAHVQAIVKALRDQGASASGEVVVGDPATRIVQLAEERRASLIAMATHGRTGFSRWVRGSIAERVLRTSAIPVLVANPFGLSERDEHRFSRILVPIDGSDRSAEILPLVSELAGLYESEVILQMVVEIAPTVDFPNASLTIGLDDAERYLGDQRAKLPGCKVRWAAEVGGAASAILERAAREKVDLIAMTTHGRTGAARWAFGSVAEHVVREAKCPLLVLRTTQDDAAGNGSVRP